MVINAQIIKELEDAYGEAFSDELRYYLLVNYTEEPFPHEFSEDDLYTNINRDIRAYGAGQLDVTVKSPSERWQEEREYLQNLYAGKACEARELLEYVACLEHMLTEHGLESPRMAQRRIDLSRIAF